MRPLERTHAPGRLSWFAASPALATRKLRSSCPGSPPLPGLRADGGELRPAGRDEDGDQARRIGFTGIRSQAVVGPRLLDPALPYSIVNGRSIVELRAHRAREHARENKTGVMVRRDAGTRRQLHDNRGQAVTRQIGQRLLHDRNFACILNFRGTRPPPAAITQSAAMATMHTGGGRRALKYLRVFMAFLRMVAGRACSLVPPALPPQVPSRRRAQANLIVL